MKEKQRQNKAGTITLALGFIIAGLSLLACNLGLLPFGESLWKLWPLLFIGLGIEYFIRRAKTPDIPVEYSIPSVLLIALFILSSLMVKTIQQMLPYVHVWHNLP